MNLTQRFVSILTHAANSARFEHERIVSMRSLRSLTCNATSMTPLCARGYIRLQKIWTGHLAPVAWPPNVSLLLNRRFVEITRRARQPGDTPVYCGKVFILMGDARLEFIILKILTSDVADVRPRLRFFEFYALLIITA